MNKSPIIIDTMGSWTARRPTTVDPGYDFIDMALKYGVSAMSETIVADVDLYDIRTVLRYFDDFHWMLHLYSDKAMLIEKADDFSNAAESGKLGFIAMIQGGNSIFEDLSMLRILHRLGLRSIGLTYMRGNALGSGCQELNDTGLTVFGQKVIKEMNRLGIAVDLSHVGPQTTLDAIHYSQAPVLFTHSNVQAVTPHPRNISDEHLRALKENGGMSLTPVSIFCRRGENRPTMDDFVMHIEYAAEKLGIEHVGVATDRLVADVFDEKMILSKTSPELLEFNLAGKHVEGFEGFNFWPKLIESLEERGFSDSDIRAVLGENYIRTIGKIWH